MKENNIKFYEVLCVLKKRIKLILSVTAICTIIVALISAFAIKPKYQGTTKLFVGKEGIEGTNSIDEANYNNNDIVMYEKVIQTYADIIHTKSLVKKALIENDLDYDPEEILKNMVVTPIENTQLISIKYIDNNTSKATNVLNAITDEFIHYSVHLIPNANVEVVEDVNVPVNPVSPNILAYSVIAFLVALATTSMVVSLLYFMNKTYSDKNEIEMEIGIPVIGDIPKLEIK